MFETIIKTISYVVAFLMLTSSFDKVKNFSSSKLKITAYNIVPSKWINLFLCIGIIAELYIGISILMNLFNAFTLLVYLILMSTYTLAIGKNILKGNIHISCGCGGVLESDSLSKNHLFRNLVLMVSGVMMYLFLGDVQFTLFHVIAMMIIAITSLYLYGSLKEYKKQLHTISKIKNILTV